MVSDHDRRKRYAALERALGGAPAVELQLAAQLRANITAMIGVAGIVIAAAHFL